MKKRWALVLAVLSLTGYLLGNPPTISIAEADANAEYSGYIVKVKEDAELVLPFAGDSGIRYLADDLYSVADPETARELEESGLTEFIEPNYYISLAAYPNDPYIDEQWNLKTINAFDAWDYAVDCTGVRVGVIDTGLRRTHEDIAGLSVAAGYNIIDESTNVDDNNGHGTEVTGIIAASTDNGIGIAGLIDSVTIVPLKCFDDDKTVATNVLKAIYLAVDDYNCDVINLSLGLNSDMRSLKAAVDYAAENGVIVLAAVGNSGDSRLFYPAAYESVIGVGSVSMESKVSSFSNRNNSIFVTAPGERVISLSGSTDTDYILCNGTSFSTPHVVALAAIAKSFDRETTTDDFKALLISAVTDLGSPGYDTAYGHGLINMDAFISLFTEKAVPMAKGSGLFTGSLEYTGDEVAYSYDLSDKFTGGSSTLTYSIYSTNAYGAVDINDSVLTFTPVQADADKQVRIVVEAADNIGSSTKNAVFVISVTSDHDVSEVVAGYTDLVGTWSEYYAGFCIERELLQGTEAGVFAPAINMTRSMFVTVLARLSGEDVTGWTCDFSDVSESDWFYENVAWAVSNGYVHGIGNNLFDPDGNITREQIATLMLRYTEIKGFADVTANSLLLYGFTDVEEISPYAQTGMTWAVSWALIGGRTLTTLDPLGVATRGEVAAILTRFVSIYEYFGGADTDDGSDTDDDTDVEDGSDTDDAADVEDGSDTDEAADVENGDTEGAVVIQSTVEMTA